VQGLVQERTEGAAIVVQRGTTLGWLNKPGSDLAEIEMRQGNPIVLTDVLVPELTQSGVDGSNLLR
jgi:hypothetical protein